MAIVTGDRYLESLVKFVEKQAEPLLEGILVLKLNPVGLHYVQSRLEALAELESLLAGAPVDYLRAYVSDLGDHRALEQLRRILRLLTSLKVISVLPAPVRDPTPLSLLPFGRLKVLELHGCDLSTSAARGLLELRHTLEKIICHNSTDALRHVFASRIAEIKDSPTWKRLSFVSCACNGLVLMDESLQLLPVVETLDLSRNKFSKVDNIRRCTKLKHLDLGFNHLRSIASFRKVSCQIVKLVLRNNALTTLRGIENLKSLEGLDLSYNIISNFSELEVLVGLPSLCSLWLEGNPVCSASWYRAQVFSFIPDPDKLKLDEKNISTREFWKRQFIIASRQKQPASFGFYSPARDEAELEGSIYTKRKKASRLASIENEEQSTFACSDNDSVSCDNEARSKYENTDADEAPEIVDLMMNKIELMKQERSIMWLEEFKEWMNQASEDLVDSDRYSGLIYPGKDNYSKNKKRQMDYGETSTYVSDSVEASMDQSSTNVLNSENLFSDISTNFTLPPYLDRVDEAAPKFSTGHLDKSLPFVGRIDSSQGYLKSHHDNGAKPVKARNSHIDITVPGSQRLGVKSGATALAGIDDVMESRSSSACPGSPPHYQEDILQRRHNLEEEFLQLSAGSYSVASSESDTSYSEDDSVEVESLISNHLTVDDLSERSVDENSFVLNDEDPNVDKRHDISQSEKSGTYPLYPSSGQIFDNLELKVRESFPQSCNMIPASAYDDEVIHLLKHEADWLQKGKNKKKLKTRVISLKEGKSIDIGAGLSSISNGTLNGCADDVQGGQISGGSNFHEMHSRDGSLTTSSINASDELSGTKSSALGTDELVPSYFNENIADSGVQETCRQYVHCNCLLEEKSGGDERLECAGCGCPFQSCNCNLHDSSCHYLVRLQISFWKEVAVLLSSEHKLYVLLLDGRFDGSGTDLRLVGCHRIEDVKEILVGLGLQVVRVYFERKASYLFITRSIDKSRQLLCILDILKSGATKYGFPLRSLEQVQVTLFNRGICGDSKLNIFQYSMVLFWHNNMEDDLWLSRSLFVLGGHLLVCIEDISQFASASEDAFSPSYFTLDSCCCIVDALELVIETGTSCCVTLSLERSMSEFCPSDMADKLEKATLAKEKSASASIKWKLKWFSEESLFKFVSLVKAIHAAAITPLIIRCTS